MTVASATDDPRFPPVTVEEVSRLRIEISALGPLGRIHVDAVEIGRHGLMIVKGRRMGLLLPQAPVHYGWSHAEYLEKLCRKADLPHEAWNMEGAQLLAFECEVWGEAC